MGGASHTIGWLGCEVTLGSCSIGRLGCEVTLGSRPIGWLGCDVTLGSRPIGRLGCEVTLVTALSLVTVVASARVSLRVGVSIIALVSLVTVNEAPVALEDLHSRERERCASSERTHDSWNK